MSPPDGNGMSLSAAEPPASKLRVAVAVLLPAKYSALNRNCSEAPTTTFVSAFERRVLPIVACEERAV